MWLSVSIFIALTILALLAYFYNAQKDTPVTPQERYMMVYEDGLLELVGGLYLILASFMFAVNPGLIGIFVPLLYVVLLSAKTAITKPRLDPAELPADIAKQRQLKMILLLGVVLLVGVAVFLFFVADLTALSGWLTPYLIPMLVLVSTVLLMLWAYRTGMGRLYLYAALVLAAYVSSFWLALTFPVYLFAIGVGLALGGTRAAVRFVQDHPKLAASG